MKPNCKNLFLQTLSLGLVFQVFCMDPVWAQSAKVEKFEMKTCNEAQKCIRIKANKAVSSQILPLYAITDVKVEIVDKNKTRVHAGKSGHVDFKNNQLVINEITGNEYAINLKTMDETEYLK